MKSSFILCSGVLKNKSGSVSQSHVCVQYCRRYILAVNFHDFMF